MAERDDKLTKDDRKQEIAGYRNTPLASRFRKGRSGNPKGRPRGRRRELPYEAVLGQEVIIRENGRERRVTAAEAFLLQLIKRGLDGDIPAARAAIAAIGDMRGTDVSVLMDRPRSFLLSCPQDASTLRSSASASAPNSTASVRQRGCCSSPGSSRPPWRALRKSN